MSDACPAHYGCVIYVVLPGQLEAPHVRLALSRLRQVTGHLIVVATQGEAANIGAGLNAPAPDCVISHTHAQTSRAGYQAGLLELFKRDEMPASVLLSGGHVFGPILGTADNQSGTQDSHHIFAPYWHRPSLDPRLAQDCKLDRIPSLDHTVFSTAMLLLPGFRAFWQGFTPSGDHWSEFLCGDLAFADWATKSQVAVNYPLDDDRLETANPSLYEAHRLINDGGPCLPVAVLTMNPLLHDLNAIELKKALAGLRVRDPDMHLAANAFAARNVKPRDFAAVADQYEVLPNAPVDPGKSQWEFGSVAVFIHAYYADMIGEFWGLMRRLPCAAHFYITTATSRDQGEISDYLTARGLTDREFTLRVVAQNRGRDMSSLFITWRDIILADTHLVALRLHSKRTPQVSRRVGENFKAHLFDNLIGSAGYVSNLLTMIEAEPDIGLVVPPVVHIGFGTLGHAWFNNRAPLAALMADMDMDVPLDDHTPMAPYGTMYWFRTDALKRMFEWNWQWDDYNPEPHHVDGGLAHIQERLIGYAARDRGYRIVTVMTPEAAARNYAKLEFKLQRLAAEMPTGNILHQVDDLAALNRSVRARLFRRLRSFYGRILIRRPQLRAALLPWRTAAVALLSPRAGG